MVVTAGVAVVALGLAIQARRQVAALRRQVADATEAEEIMRRSRERRRGLYLVPGAAWVAREVEEHPGATAAVLAGMVSLGVLGTLALNSGDGGQQSGIARATTTMDSPSVPTPRSPESRPARPTPVTTRTTLAPDQAPSPVTSSLSSVTTTTATATTAPAAGSSDESEPEVASGVPASPGEVTAASPSTAPPHTTTTIAAPPGQPPTPPSRPSGPEPTSDCTLLRLEALDLRLVCLDG